MDIYSLKEHLNVANILGATLNIEQRLRIDLAIGKLIEHNPQIEQFKFWGRIDGTIKSYYIIIGYNYQTYQFPHKTFFWAINPDFIFNKFEEQLYEQHKVHLEKINKNFIGKPNQILVNLESEEDENAEQQAQNAGGEQGQEAKKQQIDSEQQDNKQPPKKNLTELNRLSVVVRAIENDCQVVPVGSYKMSPQHSLHSNQTFKSKSSSDSLSLANWQHFRAPQSQSKRQAIDSQQVIFNHQFLDTLTQDKPIGCWATQVDTTNNHTTIRNLIWPGYFAYVKANTSFFGSCYFGQGKKNINLSYQL